MMLRLEGINERILDQELESASLACSIGFFPIIFCYFNFFHAVLLISLLYYH